MRGSSKGDGGGAVSKRQKIQEKWSPGSHVEKAFQGEGGSRTMREALRKEEEIRGWHTRKQESCPGHRARAYF